MFIDNPYVQAGFTAAVQGLPQTANPLLHKAQPFALWEVGHTLATLLNSQDTLNAEPLERAEKSAYDQGCIAFTKGVELTDNPYSNGDLHGTPDERATWQARADWSRGWHWKKLAGPLTTDGEPPKHWDCSKRCVDALNPVPTEYSKGETQPNDLSKLSPEQFNKLLDESNQERQAEYASPGLFSQQFGRIRRPRFGIELMDFGGSTRFQFISKERYDSRVSELLEANNREVERRRAETKLRIDAERRLSAIAEAIAGVNTEADPNRV